MKTLEERVQRYCADKCPNASKEVITLVCRTFKDGAKSEHAELIRWHDPNTERPPRNVEVLIKLRDTYRDDKIHYSVGYINGACWFGDGIGAADEVVGWREISEKE